MTPTSWQDPLTSSCFTSISQAFGVIENVHNDDVHGLIKLENNTFVSGSKDTTLKIWDVDWNCISLLRHPHERLQPKSYCHWITALAIAEDGQWMSGTRDGSLALWSSSGGLVSWHQNSFNHNVKSKDRNICRINCLTTIPRKGESLMFLSGLPAMMATWTTKIDRNKKVGIKRLSGLDFSLSKNDWVYCIKAVSSRNDTFFVATGSDLDVVKMKKLPSGDVVSWKQKEKVVREALNTTSTIKQRPFISYLENLSEETLAIAAFSGKVSLLNIETKRITNSFRAHSGRVWTICKISETFFASGADDKSIAFWDIRQKRPFHFLRGHSGRVSCLLKVADFKVVAASCPDNCRAVHSGASFTIWDLRND
ncbi:WD40 repeat domain-containing protein [Parachlamydia acanthamoebae]|jgi:WD40 repeat protein|uniref:Uncharacterized protein n=1 Tax=Parachlamydia acanthamoebae (strain UV7) TaxID=765952 RepID=F8KWH4_PARAV|nr:hypothetical protein [Parachlamydia acanthamoebae]EFB42396.1 hypothetical protein pah_c009o043 [Parachlamydia acanthamoebae str. Hall's coccus]CCB85372.1 putative uncharacterized protein [Parachlamydia acanthamoebae UV-7]